MRSTTLLLASLVMLAGFAIDASSAAVTTFTDKPTYNAAVGGGQTLEDFLPGSHFPITSGVLNSLTNEAGIFTGDIQSGVTYSTPVGTGNFFNIDAGGGFIGGFLDSIESTGQRNLFIDFDNPVAAFGFDTNSLMGLDSFDVTISFTVGPDYTDTFAVPGFQIEFFGFQGGQTDILSVEIDGGGVGFNYAIDNFVFGGGLFIPEPSALTLAALGPLGFLVWNRRRRHTA